MLSLYWIELDYCELHSIYDLAHKHVQFKYFLYLNSLKIVSWFHLSYNWFWRMDNSFMKSSCRKWHYRSLLARMKMRTWTIFSTRIGCKTSFVRKRIKIITEVIEEQNPSCTSQQKLLNFMSNFFSVLFSCLDVPFHVLQCIFWKVRYCSMLERTMELAAIIISVWFSEILANSVR